MTAVCGRDGQWSPNPGNITCSPRSGENDTFATFNTQYPAYELCNVNVLSKKTLFTFPAGVVF